METEIDISDTVVRVMTDAKHKVSVREYDADFSLQSGDSPHIQEATQLLQKKKQLHPLLAMNHPYRAASQYGPRTCIGHPSSRTNVSVFTQRVMSAKLLRVKQLQNELTETQNQLQEVISENRLLRTLQKRQDTALKKYEGTNAQLPQLIKHHNDEMRVLTAKYKQLRSSYREIADRLKQRECELTNLREQHKHLLQLARDRHLGDRERLAAQVLELQDKISSQQLSMQTLSRKVELETKNFRHQLNAEMLRHRDTQSELAEAAETIENLKSIVDAKEKCINSSVPKRYYKSQAANSHQPQSLASLPRYASQQIRSEASLITTANAVETETKTAKKGSVEEQHQSSVICSDQSDPTPTSESVQTSSEHEMHKSKHKQKVSNKKVKGSSKSIQQKQTAIKATDSEYSRYTSTHSSNNVSFNETPPVMDSGFENKGYVLDGINKRVFQNKLESRFEESVSARMKERRNSLPDFQQPSAMHDEITELLSQANLTSNLKRQQYIKDELKELEEKMRQGEAIRRNRENSLDIETDEMVRNACKGMRWSSEEEEEEGVDEENKELERDVDLAETPHSGNLCNEYAELGEPSFPWKDSGLDNSTGLSWNELQEKIQTGRSLTESKLEEYCKSQLGEIMKAEAEKEEEEPIKLDAELEGEQKERLLKALQNIDRGESPQQASDESESAVYRLLANRERRKSDAYNFSQAVENLHRGKPVYPNIRVPVLERMRREEQEYVADYEQSGRAKKNKADLMKELFDNNNYADRPETGNSVIDSPSCEIARTFE